MESFTQLTGIAAPLPLMNVDTDMIIPKQFLKTIKRSGLGVSLFFDMRYGDDGRENPEFVLNRAPFRDARILIAGENFGCGSSREHAPWALMDFGIRSIVAPSFADIFYNNCFKNGILPVVLARDDVEGLLDLVARQPGTELTVRLDAQRLDAPAGRSYAFEVDPFRKQCLLHGLDDIGLTLQKAPAIGAFEARQKAQQPWLSR
jgi:3-isopropylmalate/(R)-2-methylmalate dehydratase small subunit